MKRGARSRFSIRAPLFSSLLALLPPKPHGRPRRQAGGRGGPRRYARGPGGRQRRDRGKETGERRHSRSLPVLQPSPLSFPSLSLPSPVLPPHPQKLQKLEYQVLHLTRALKAADAALDAALAPGADLEALREKRWDAAPVGGK